MGGGETNEGLQKTRRGTTREREREKGRMVVVIIVIAGNRVGEYRVCPVHVRKKGKMERERKRERESARVCICVRVCERARKKLNV